MRRIVKAVFGVLWWGFTALLSPAAYAEEAPIEVTVYADAGYPPYSYVEQGVAVGIYAEILKRAFARMPRYRVTIAPVPWRRGLAFIESGQAFAIFPPYYHPTTRPYMRPYSEPILDEKVVVFCRADVLARPRLRWPEDYLGLVIGSNAGFMLGGEAFRAAVSAGKIRYEEVGGNEQNIRKLIAGRLDCYVNDRLAVLWEYGRLRRKGGLLGDRPDALQEGAVISREQGFLGFTDKDSGRFPYKADFIAEFNAIIVKMRTSGEINNIVSQFLGR